MAAIICEETGAVLCHSLPVPLTLDTEEEVADHAEHILLTTGNSPLYRVQDAIDGTGIRIFFHGNKWKKATNKCDNAYRSAWNPNMSFGEMFDEASRNMRIDYTSLDRQCNYFFILCHPRNRIVYTVTAPYLYHVATIHCPTGNYVNRTVRLAKGIYSITPKCYTKLYSLEEVRQLAIGENIGQGVIAIDPNDNRINIRNPLYVKYHNLRGNEPSPLYRYHQLMRGQINPSEYLAFYPENGWAAVVHQIICHLYGTEFVNCMPDRDFWKLAMGDFRANQNIYKDIGVHNLYDAIDHCKGKRRRRK